MRDSRFEYLENRSARRSTAHRAAFQAIERELRSIYRQLPDSSCPSYPLRIKNPPNGRSFILEFRTDETEAHRTADDPGFSCLILSSRSSVIQWVICTYLSGVLDTASVRSPFESADYLFLGSGLKIRVSVVRFRPWPPFKTKR